MLSSGRDFLLTSEGLPEGGLEEGTFWLVLLECRDEDPGGGMSEDLRGLPDSEYPPPVCM